MELLKNNDDGSKLYSATLPEVLTLMQVSFTLKYKDGTEHEVKEGVCFEITDDEHVVFHNGTNRPNVLFACMECMFEAISYFGLTEECEKYLGIGKEENEEQKEVGNDNV